MKNRSVNMMIVAILILALFSAAIIFFIADTHEKFPNRIMVRANGITESIIDVDGLYLRPAGISEYDINLVCAATGSYYVYLDYEEKADGGMKEFVHVVIESDGEPVYEGSLSALLAEGEDEKIVEYISDLDDDEPNVITIRYSMSDLIGNEAQGTYSSFRIHLKIVKK